MSDTLKWRIGFFVGALIMVILLQIVSIYRLQKDINALIELNHDKSVYIDAGCRGHYQGAEEFLPGETQ
jgi:hypothetical protein